MSMKAMRFRIIDSHLDNQQILAEGLSLTWPKQAILVQSPFLLTRGNELVIGNKNCYSVREFPVFDSIGGAKFSPSLRASSRVDKYCIRMAGIPRVPVRGTPSTDVPRVIFT
jgi:hypothetical protein